MEPFLKNSYGLTSSQVGLVLMPFGLTYTAFAPIVGFLTDKGLNGLFTILFGNLVIAVAYIFLGPVPPIYSVLGSQLWITTAAIGLQGIGSAATYIGTLLYMTKSVIESGLPQTEQASAMVSSLWLASECMGCFIGSTIGSVAFDLVGFKMGTMLYSCSMGVSVLLVAAYALQRRALSDTKCEKLQTDQTPLLVGD